MKIISKVSAMQSFSLRSKRKDLSIGFVPTMGALHQGHLSLIKAAKKENDLVVVSIFVNPLQFGPKEDFKKYPRNLAQDIKWLKREGVDILFHPSVSDMYKDGDNSTVEVKGFDKVLCGARRPGHFKGVTTVVSKLFNIVMPDNAYFGLKDYQQQLIIRAMVKDLNHPVKIRSLPIVREKDGLAMSSRNRYLSNKQRVDAANIYRSLCQAKKLIRQGEKSNRIVAEIKKMIRNIPDAKVDYITMVDPDTLKKVERIRNRVLVALAIFIGKTRLIDNIIVNI